MARKKNIRWWCAVQRGPLGAAWVHIGDTIVVLDTDGEQKTRVFDDVCLAMDYFDELKNRKYRDQ